MVEARSTDPAAPDRRSPDAKRVDVERLVFFTDAVVAIAMTLMILPLMDAVADAADEGLDAWGYVRENVDPLISFLLSFVIIARFWRSHHRLFARVEWEVPGLFALNIAWLVAIVFLPVATSMTGLMSPSTSVFAVYIGAMLVAALLMAAMIVLLRRHPEAWRAGEEVPAELALTALVVCLLMAVALLLAVVVPGLGYFALLVLLLGRPVHWTLDRGLARYRLARHSPAHERSHRTGSA